jgi:hypothetical protein
LKKKNKFHTKNIWMNIGFLFDAHEVFKLATTM